MYDDLQEELGPGDRPGQRRDPDRHAARHRRDPAARRSSRSSSRAAPPSRPSTGPGCRLDTVLPGQPGVSVLVGRRATFGAPFADLDQLRTGDLIVVTTGQGQFTTSSTWCAPATRPTRRSSRCPSRLTLVTSDPAITPTRQPPWSPPSSTAKPLPATDRQRDRRPTTCPARAARAGWSALLLWAQLLLIVTCVSTWAALRVPGRAASGSAPCPCCSRSSGTSSRTSPSCSPTPSEADMTHDHGSRPMTLTTISPTDAHDRRCRRTDDAAGRRGTRRPRRRRR